MTGLYAHAACWSWEALHDYCRGMEPSRGRPLPEHLDLRAHPLDRSGSSQFTDRFAYLLEQVPNPETGRAWSNRDLAEAMARHDCDVSEDYIRRLRTGGRDNPTLRVLLAIMTVLQVPPGYFFQPTVKLEVDTSMPESGLPVRRSVRGVDR